jgi:hypothetical protein
VNVVSAPEFMARRIAQNMCLRAGYKAQASRCSRLAAKHYKAGASVFSAPREAFASVSGQQSPKWCA